MITFPGGGESEKLKKGGGSIKKNKNEYPVTVHTLSIESAIKAAAKEKNPTYFEVKDADLIARELRYHKTSYKAFTKEPTLSASHTQSVDE